MTRTSLLQTAKLFLLCLPLLLLQNCTKETLSVEADVQQPALDMVIDIDQMDDYEAFDNPSETATERWHQRMTFKTLNAAIACTGLSSTVFSGKKTVYAPTDAAFAKLGLNEDNVCSALDKETLTNILAYHVNEGLITVDKRGCIKPLNGDVARLDFCKGSYVINDSRFMASGIMNGKGFLTIIYAIDMVLTPPAKNIVETAMAANDFNSLVAAVLATDPAVAAVLTNNNAVFTVFAPTDKAFAELLSTLGVSSIEGALAKVGSQGLKKILLYHVVNGCATTDDLKNGMMLTTSQGETVTVDLRNKGIKDKTGKTARFIKGGLNILTANGFIHTIDKVLLPQEILDAL